MNCSKLIIVWLNKVVINRQSNWIVSKRNINVKFYIYKYLNGIPGEDILPHIAGNVHFLEGHIKLGEDDHLQPLYGQ